MTDVRGMRIGPGRRIPAMVYGVEWVGFPKPVGDALVDVANAMEDYFMGAGGDTARVAGDALTRLHEAWEEHGG